MISFESDYNNGMLPEILEALGKTNGDKTYSYSASEAQDTKKQKNVYLCPFKNSCIPYGGQFDPYAP